jgi:hypothetical protein
MACEERCKCSRTRLAICHASIPYPCGIRWCQSSFSYPCGIEWCSSWGIPYPCGVEWCNGTISYPCGFDICYASVPYPCIRSVEVDGWCYEFWSIGETCYGFRKKVYGCCEGREYSWWAWCAGYFTDYAALQSVCLTSKPKGTAGCNEGNSVPPGGEVPGGPLDPGRVAPGPRRLEYYKQRWGCAKCTVVSGVLAFLFWLGLGDISYSIPTAYTAALGLWILFSLIFGVHLGSLMLRWASRDKSGCRPCAGQPVTERPRRVGNSNAPLSPNATS